MIVGYKVWTPKMIRVRKRMEFYQRKVCTASSSIRKAKKYRRLLLKHAYILRTNGFYFYDDDPKYNLLQ
jgi:hypothetical protein